jgi:nucleosome assembly protein 1-like 1
MPTKQFLEPRCSEYQSQFLQRNSIIGGKICGLLNLQSRYEALNEQWNDDVWKLSQRYHARCQKIYQDRQAIINGTKRCATPSHAGGIHQFWLRAMKNNPIVGRRIAPRDEPALSYLCDVRVEFMDRGVTGFRVLFDFDENPFFSNSTLVKEFIYERTHLDGDIYGQWPYKRADGCAINWKPGQNLAEILGGRHANPGGVGLVCYRRS